MTAAPDDWTLGASDCPALLRGELPRLYDEATGARPRRDLSGVLAVRLGQATEAFHRAWFSERTCLALRDPQRRLRFGGDARLHATVDALLEDGTPFEGKFFSAWADLPRAARWKAGQVQAQMLCAGAPRAVLSLITRDATWAAGFVEPMPELQDEILQRLDLLAWCVGRGARPPALARWEVEDVPLTPITDLAAEAAATRRAVRTRVPSRTEESPR